MGSKLADTCSDSVAGLDLASICVYFFDVHVEVTATKYRSVALKLYLGPMRRLRASFCRLSSRGQSKVV